MNPRYPAVAARAGHRCEYCRAPEAIFNFPFEVEHIIPVADHGPDDETNLCPACRSCNLHKSNYRLARDPETGTELRLFDPRQQSWDRHFRVDPDTGAVLGLAPIGRATAARMQMNSPLQVAARRLWMKLRLYP